MIPAAIYDNSREALNAVLKADRHYIIIKHKFPKNYIVKEHFHPNTDEWLIVDSGRFEINCDFEKKEFDVDSPHVVHFPKGHIHGLRCITNLMYIVIREIDDEIIYLKDIIKKTSSVKPKQDTCGLIWELYDSPNLSIAYVRVLDVAQKHKHSFEEIYRIEKGKGRLIMDGQCIDIKKGDVILIPKNRWHYLKKTSNESFEVLVVTHPRFSPDEVVLEV